MADSGRTELARRTNYDNITIGSQVTSKERTISGSLPPAKLTGGGEGSAGANAKGRSDIAVGSTYQTANIQDNIAVGSVTPVLEKVKVGG